MSTTKIEIKNQVTPDLYGLVLAGGKSERMGKDKGLLQWHGKPQRYYLADMLAAHCDQVYISCREDQVQTIEDDGYRALPDGSPAVGQYGAILTAMSAHPDAAWLVVACDLPLFDSAAMQYLIDRRDPDMLATAYAGDDNLPEPLAAIWEPRSQDMLRDRLTEGITCPRKALIRSASHVKLVPPPDPDVIANANTPEEADRVRQIIATKAA